MINLVLAWRNLWRNKRRTLITTAMIFLAVVLSVTMQSVQRGIYDRNIDNIVRYSMGYIQVGAAGHHEDKTLETSVELTDELIDKIKSVKGVADVLPRIENVGLVATDTSSKEALIQATDPEVEDKLTGLRHRVISGEYINQSDRSVMIASGLAKRLRLQVNDTIIILSIGYHGTSANGKYPVKAILELGSPELNRRMIYMPLKMAQNMFYLGDNVSNISVLLEDKRRSEEIATEIQAAIGDEYEALHWKQLLPELSQMIEGDEASGNIMFAILYVIIAFGVFGTVLMMLAERRREFGVVTAIGMKRHKLAVIVVLENFITAFMGALLGMVGAMGPVLALKNNPVSLAGDMKEAYEKLGFEPVITADVYQFAFVNNALLVFFIALVLSIYPLVKILRIKPIDYLRS
ncbi:MAG: ABC transporter permease [Flavobacteriales bacterium]|nr:ABC transporter permease [Bacteroidota bacterium]MCB9240018.1 ABC transporter permease [Flavobacteriales bacterium]